MEAANSLFFTSGAMKSTDIKRNIKLIIKESNRIGLNVVATVCDQMSANRTAIKKLMEETEAYYKREGREKKILDLKSRGRKLYLYTIHHIY